MSTDLTDIRRRIEEVADLLHLMVDALESQAAPSETTTEPACAAGDHRPPVYSQEALYVGRTANCRGCGRPLTLLWVAQPPAAEKAAPETYGANWGKVK